jgi:hypothetical protein
MPNQIIDKLAYLDYNINTKVVLGGKNENLRVFGTKY